MKHSTRFTRQLLGVTTAGIVAIGFAGNVHAVDAKAEAEAGTQAGATASTHMGSTGTANTNAQWQGAATKGDARAAARMNAKGAEKKHDGSAELEAAAPTKRKP